MTRIYQQLQATFYEPSPVVERAVEIWAWYRTMCEEHDYQVEALYNVEPTALYPQVPEPVRQIEQHFAAHAYQEALKVLRYEGIDAVASSVAKERVSRFALRHCQDIVRRARWFDSGEPNWKTEDRWQRVDI